MVDHKATHLQWSTSSRRVLLHQYKPLSKTPHAGAAPTNSPRAKMLPTNVRTSRSRVSTCPMPPSKRVHALATVASISQASATVLSAARAPGICSPATEAQARSVSREKLLQVVVLLCLAVVKFLERRLQSPTCKSPSTWTPTWSSSTVTRVVTTRALM